MSNDTKATVGSGNRQYKDALFKFIFGSEERKEFTLELYNALNGTDYTDTSLVEFKTLEDVMYINYHNDVACMIDQNIINLWEEQSTWNPNMALRMLMYSVSLWSNHLFSTKQDMTYRRLVKIPYVNCVVLYNGKESEPATRTISIRDNFSGECPKYVTPLDFSVMVYNINTKAGKELLSRCKPLLEYSWVISKVQEYTDESKSLGIPYLDRLTIAIEKALNGIPESFALRKILLAKQEEVISMLLTEFDAKMHDEIVYDDGYDKGVVQGIEQGAKQMRVNNVVSFRNAGASIEMIMQALGFSREEVLNILAEHKKKE